MNNFRSVALVTLLFASLAGRNAVAQNVQTGDPQNLSPAAVVERYAHALIAKDWATCVSLTDPEELARNKAAFAPIFQRDSSGQLASQVLGAPRQLVVSSLS
ncbi:MAG: hypothetical protein JWL97_779, partial [Gemmatimonadales bacterium]|nr:hypothetical protein [Gemmatimonadales bacterium]